MVGVYMITAVSMIKNAADVVETMIRGNALTVDNFVIVNNSSTDNTVKILNSLKEEGFSIDILDDESISYLQQDITLNSIRYALEKYSPDFIIPVDDDEIICPNDDSVQASDLKDIIENLDQDKLYYMNWRNYIPTDADDPGQTCVALREKYCLDDETEMTKKVIIPAKIARDRSFSIAVGSHYAQSDNISEHVELHDIRLAHYPIRSSVQIASKAIVGWMNVLALPNRKEEMSAHWRVMYKAIKEYGLPTTDTMMTLANLYREHPNDAEHLNVVCHPIDLPDSVFELKYTGKSEINLLKNICENIERIAGDYAHLQETLSSPEDE